MADQSAPELVVAQTQWKNVEVGKEKQRKIIAGWFTKMLEEVACKQAGVQGH